jgi:hypothetical protein
MMRRMVDAVLLATQNDVWFGDAPVVLPGVLNFPFGAGSNATTESLDDRTYNGPSSSARCGRAFTVP